MPAFEAALLAWTHACKEKASLFSPDEPRLNNWREPDRQRPAAVHDILAFGRSLDGFLKGGVGGRLSRYENALQRQLSAMMLELRRMQARRKVHGSRDVCVGAATAEGDGVTPRLALTAQDAGMGEADSERPRGLLDRVS